MDNKKFNLINAMALCYGTEDYYTNKSISFDYTDGIKAFCENSGAYWLLDLVESVIKARPIMNTGILVGIRLKVKDNNTAVITFRDGVRIIYNQVIPYTDCPSGVWKFYYRDGVFMWCDEN